MSRWPSNTASFGQPGPDTLYLELTAYKIKQQNSSVASAKGINKSKIGGPYELLMPKTFSTTISHTWENVDQLGTRFMQKYNKIQTLVEDAKNVNNVVTRKLDTPVTFKDSNRRTLDITVELADQGSTYYDVFTPVRQLEKWSCAKKGDGTLFELPYIFTVKTKTADGRNPLISINNAALISVQPTYYGPYRNGYPSKCELTLSFKDMEPLYRTSFGTL